MAPARALAGLRRRATLVLWLEILLRALAPAGLIFLAYLTAAVAGLGNGWVLFGVLPLLAASLIWEAREIRPPRPADIDRRIEAASGLRHRPLAALSDQPANATPLAAEIWALHQARATQMLATARAGWPAPFAATRDPFSLRALLLLLFAIALVSNGPGAAGRLGAAFSPPDWPFAGPTINAWITPPAYSGQAPILLNPGQPVTVLTGSQLTVLLNGSTAAIRLGGKPLPEAILAPASRRADTVLAASARLAIGPWWHRLASWQITTIPPAAPTITLAPLEPDEQGVKLSWQVSDPYGLSSLTATIHPLGYPSALPEGAALPSTTGQSTTRLDTMDSPYAGLPIAVTLQATNLASVTARSAPQTITLPPAALTDPTAFQLSLVRQYLALTPADAPAIAPQIMRIAQAPPSAISFAADLQLATLAAALRIGVTSPAGAVGRLLALIQQIDAGPDYRPGQALAQANANLLHALANGPPDAATLNKLLAALQQALAAHLAAIRPAPTGQPQQTFDSSALSQLANQIAADERAGRAAQAQAELQQLARALNESQTARPMTATQAAQSQAAGQAAQKLSQLVQAEAALLDQTTEGKAKPGQQGQLQTELTGIGKELAKAGLPHPAGLNGAAQSMTQAQSALARQDTGTAQSAETAAIQSLQQAAATLQNMAEQGFAIRQDGELPDDSYGPNGTGEDLSIPGLNLPASNPADAIEQEIIRLDADPSLPPATHAYLRRLLAPDP